MDIEAFIPVWAVMYCVGLSIIFGSVIIRRYKRNRDYKSYQRNIEFLKFNNNIKYGQLLIYTPTGEMAEYNGLALESAAGYPTIELWPVEGGKSIVCQVSKVKLMNVIDYMKFKRKGSINE